MIEPKGLKKVKVIQVIETTSAIGNGTEQNPARCITQYWSLKGALLAERDEWKSDVRISEQQEDEQLEV